MENIVQSAIVFANGVSSARRSGIRVYFTGFGVELASLVIVATLALRWTLPRPLRVLRCVKHRVAIGTL